MSLVVDTQKIFVCVKIREHCTFSKSNILVTKIVPKIISSGLTAKSAKETTGSNNRSMVYDTL